MQTRVLARFAFQACSFIRLRSRLSPARATARCPAEAAKPRARTTTRTSLRSSGINGLPEGGEPRKGKLWRADDIPEASDHWSAPLHASASRMAEVNLDMGTQWKPTFDAADSFEGCCSTKGDVLWTASRVDLVFGSNSELRALAEVYACDDARTSSCATSSPPGTR
jgi:hypothetical protein